MGLCIRTVYKAAHCNRGRRYVVGPGVQPQPRKLHRAHTVSARLGAPQVRFRPSEIRPAHGQVTQWGRSPAPGR